MKSADDIKRLFKDAELSIHPDTDEQVFNDVLQAQQKITEDLPVVPNRWRMTMKNPLTKLAIAAVVAVACLIGLSLWTGTGSGIALADVLTRIEQVSVYMYQISMTVTGQAVGDRPMDQEMQGTVLISQDQGTKMSMEMVDPNSGESILQEQYMLPHEKAMIMIIPSKKKYVRMELDDTLVERAQKQNNDPRAMIKKILECDYKSIGKSTIDGIEVEGFQTTDPSYQGGAFGGQVDVKIWVDVKTWLPIRSEMDIQVRDTMHMHGVVNDFQWDVSVDAAEFEPVIPDDYTTLAGGPIKMPAINEETAIQGLRLFAELSGQYPEEINLMTLMSQMREFEKSDIPAAKQLQEETKELEGEEKSRKIMDTMMPILGLGSFYISLVQDKKDPAYYGEFVTPEDADQVLMRWKVSDNEYRVVFGDLHAETVTAEVLAELEKTLPK